MTTKIPLDKLLIHYYGNEHGYLKDELIRVSSSYIQDANAVVEPKKCFIEIESITDKHQMQRYMFIMYILHLIICSDHDKLIISKKDSNGAPYIKNGIEYFAIYIKIGDKKHVWFKVPVEIVKNYKDGMFLLFEKDFAPEWDGVHTTIEDIMEILP